MTKHDEQSMAAPDGGDSAETVDTVDATGQLAELRGQLAEAQGALAEARAAAEASERRRQLERALLEADTVDLEAATMLAEAAGREKEEPDLAAVVAQLQVSRPHLFRQRTSLGGAMSEHIDPPGAIQQAARAASTGDRRALLSYLRLRRASN